MSDLNKYVEKIVPSLTANATPLKKCEKENITWEKETGTEENKMAQECLR